MSEASPNGVWDDGGLPCVCSSVGRRGERAKGLVTLTYNTCRLSDLDLFLLALVYAGALSWCRRYKIRNVENTMCPRHCQDECVVKIPCQNDAISIY